MSKLPRGLTKEANRYRIQFTSKVTRPQKRYRERLPEGTKKREAENYLAKLREDDRMGRLLWPDEREAVPEKPSTPTVGEFAVSTYMPYCAARNAAKTIRAKRQAFEASEPWFWDVPLDEVDLELACKYQAERKTEGVSNRTVNMQWETIRHMLQHAHRLGKIPNPPPLLDPLPTTRKHRKPFRYLTEDEAQQALRNAADKGAMWYALTLFLLSTGARWTETRLLKWSDVDFVRGEVYLSAHGSKHGEPRYMPMLPELIEALEAMPKGGELVWMRRRLGTGDWIELQEDARALGRKYPWQGSGDTEIKVSPHVFRHTFATWRLQRGESAKIVSVFLGHASTKLTTDTYGHVIPTDKPDAITNAPRPFVRRLRLVGEDDPGAKNDPVVTQRQKKG